MRLGQSLEPQPRCVDGAFGSGIDKYVIEEGAKGAAKKRGYHWDCHNTVVSIPITINHAKTYGLAWIGI